MNINKSGLFHYTGSGLENVYLKSGFEIHETSYGEGYSIMNVENLHRVLGLDIVRNVSGLNGAHIRFLRKELDLAQKALADVIGVTEDTIRNWETGRVEINKAADLVLRKYYIEYVDGDGSIHEMIERIANLDRVDYHIQLEFRDSEKEWHTANLAA